MAGIPLPQGDAFDSFTQGFHLPDNLMKNMLERQRLKQQADYMNNPHPSGDVANAMFVEQQKLMHGEDSPQYMQAKRAHEMALAGRQSLMDYRTQLSNLAPLRATTPLGKSLAEARGEGALNLFPHGGAANNVNPGASRTLSEQDAKAYEQDIAKKTTDAAIRNKIPYAENVKITMDSIKPDDLVSYSGPMGSAMYAKDFVQAGLGNPSPQFMAYNQAVTGAKTLAKQLRQFWGDSIQPSARQEIEKLTNPSHWAKSPEVAKQQYLQLKKITDQELENFTKHGTSPVKLGFKDGNFVSEAKKGQETGNEINANTTEDFLKQMEPELLQMDPKYTLDAIRQTADKRKMSPEEVIDILLAKYKAKNGVQ